MQHICPILFVILCLASCVGYACERKWVCAAYWLAAAVINVCVILMAAKEEV